MSSPVSVFRRAVPLATTVVLAISGVTAPADAQTRDGGSAWTLELAMPSATQTPLNGGDGISWDQFRKNGLVLSARGSGEASLVIYALTLRDGRLVDRWKSPPFPATAGRTPVSGRYLPAVQKAHVNGATVGRELVDVSEPLDVLANAGNAGNAGNARSSVVIFAAPEGSIPGSRANSIAAHIEPVID